MAAAPILIGDEWRPSESKRTFQSVNPRTKEPVADLFPISDWSEVEQAIQWAAKAFVDLGRLGTEPRARFLELLADRIEARAAQIVAKGHEETALPVEPRLKTVELPRTTGQLRQAAAAVRSRSWTLPTIDTKNNIRSMYEPIGPVCVFGPNNFPFAFNGISGGDFAAAIAAGNPVVAKANSSHPGVTRLLAEEALAASKQAGLPPGSIQLLYRLDHADGERLVAHPLVGATGYTGSRSAGLALKRAADAAGKPIYLELSSVNPVVFLPGAIAERGPALAAELQGSCLMGTGQFCTSPGLILLLAGAETDQFVNALSEGMKNAPIGTLLSSSVERSLSDSVQKLRKAGAELLVGGAPGGGAGHSFANTLLRASGRQFMQDSEALQTEAFGNCALVVVADDVEELLGVLERLEGNLTGAIYSKTTGEEELYHRVESILRRKVGRLLNDKMPTGVAVSPAMNHGGPYPATGHPGFTAVGIPAALRRFAMLCCYDAVRADRLPTVLRDQNISEAPQRFIDGVWTTANVGDR